MFSNCFWYPDIIVLLNQSLGSKVTTALAALHPLKRGNRTSDAPCMKAVKIASDNFDRSFALAVSMATSSVFGEWSVSGENLTRLGVELSEVLGMKPVHIPHPSRRTISINQFGLQCLLS